MFERLPGSLDKPGLTERELVRKFIKYIFVGVMNSAFAYALFALFLFSGVHYRLSVLLTLIIGILFNFKTIGGIVFKNNDNALIFRFVLSYLVIYVIAVSGLAILKRYGLNMYWGGVLLMPFGAVVSFVLFNVFVFRKTRCL